MSGITPEGFDRKRLDTILDDMRTAFKVIFGADLNTSPESPDGQVIGVVAAALADLWEIAEGSYDAFNPSIATGAVLTNLVQLNGIFRKEATPSKAVLTMTGINGTVIPINSIISASDGSSKFSTDIQNVIPPSGSIEGEATSIVDGPTPASAGTLIVIDTPISGWSSVVNNSDAILGLDSESDSDLRARRVRSVARPAQAILEAILAEVLDVPGVSQAFVYENDTEVTDSSDTPPKSFQVVARGGDDNDVAAAIFREKAVGILSYGSNVWETVLDVQGFEHVIGFTRPAEVSIYVTVNINIFGDYPGDGADIIKQAIVDYASGNLVNGRGFNIGDAVINSELYCPVSIVDGLSINNILQGTTSGPSSSSDIPISFSQVSTFSVDNIIVNETPLV